MARLILLAGSSCVGKTTVAQEVEKRTSFLFKRYEKFKDPTKRAISAISAFTDATIKQEKLPIIMDRAPVDYYVWSNKIRNVNIPWIDFHKFAKAYSFYTVLVYKEYSDEELKQCCANRLLNIKAQKKAQEFYKFLFKEGHYRGWNFLRKIKLGPGEFLTIEHIKDLLH
jgi:hypothetical protein